MYYYFKKNHATDLPDSDWIAGKAQEAASVSWAHAWGQSPRCKTVCLGQIQYPKQLPLTAAVSSSSIMSRVGSLNSIPH
jgi:hypothetical protein